MPWRINKYVLGVMEMFWDQGGGHASVPLKYDSNFEKNIHHQVYDYQIKESVYSKKREFTKSKQKQNDVISLKSDFILKLQVAKAFKNLNVPIYKNPLTTANILSAQHGLQRKTLSNPTPSQPYE